MGTTSYSYDGDGRRVKKVTGGVTTIYVYDVMGKLVAEYNDSQQQPTGGTKYMTTDHLGSTRVVTSQNQSVVARYDYLPFGEEIGAGVGSRTTAMGYGGNDTTRQKFTSKERDSESGLDYFEARYYSSAQGRFTSVDPDLQSGDNGDPQTWNRYAYTSNNPTNRTDPNGKRWFTKDGQTPIWVNPNADGTYTSPGEGWNPFIPTKDNHTFLYYSSGYGVLLGENPDGSPFIGRPRAAAIAEDVSLELALAGNTIYRALIMAQESYEVWRAMRDKRPAGQKLRDLTGRTRNEARRELEQNGFSRQNDTRGGYEKWRHEDGSEVWIRPGGEVVRIGPRQWRLDGSEKFSPRYDQNGEPIPYEPGSGTHGTGEILRE